MPGARVVVAQSQFKKGTALGNGGETIKIEDANNSTVTEFAYDDTRLGQLPRMAMDRASYWSNPGHAEPKIATNWRSSAYNKGNPGPPTRSRSAARGPIAYPLSVRLK
ncbi:MAG: hypothetical protein Ct9H300mP7_5300 [Verrucomicrobiota bacterium]|nr:MAG: hypothetical protein Ct9H300mP7_5300 [Verrucomicrobiota bacterium]